MRMQMIRKTMVFFFSLSLFWYLIQFWKFFSVCLEQLECVSILF